MKELTAVVSLLALVSVGNVLFAFDTPILTFPSAINVRKVAALCRDLCAYQFFNGASSPGTVLARKEGWSLEI
jgi:hypothetical protein